MYSEEIELEELNKPTEVPTLDSVPPELLPKILRLLDGAGQRETIVERHSKVSALYVSPLSKRSLIWSILYLNIFYLIQMQISLSIAFGPSFVATELTSNALSLFIYIGLIVFLILDVLFSFQKGYYAFGKGRVIDDHKLIIKHYLSGQFIIDLISIGLYFIPLIYSSYFMNFLQIAPAGLFWIKKFKYQQEIMGFLRYRRDARNVVALTILFVDVLMIGNYGACLFVGMDILLLRIQFFGTNAAYYWLSNNTSYGVNLVGGLWYIQYVYAQQFSTGTLSTLAPGPFAKNPIQILYAIFLMVFFMILASYVGEVLVSILYSESEKRIFHEEHIQSFDVFMQMKNVAKAIRNRVYYFFELIWEVEIKMESKQQQEIIDKLPAHLKEELLVQIGFTKFIHFIHRMPNSTHLEKEISFVLKRATIDANSCIFTHLSHKSSPISLYFIREGMAKYYFFEAKQTYDATSIDKQQMIHRQKIINISNVQKILGLYEFVTEQQYTYCCRTIDLCSMQTITLAQFKNIMQKMGLTEHFQLLRNEVLVEGKLSAIRKICILCLGEHIESNCPEISASVRAKQCVLNSSRTDCTRRPFARNTLRSKKLKNCGRRPLDNPLENLLSGMKLSQFLLNFVNVKSFEVAYRYDTYYPLYNCPQN